MGAGGAGCMAGEKLTGFNVTETELDTNNDEI